MTVEHTAIIEHSQVLEVWRYVDNQSRGKILYQYSNEYINNGYWLNARTLEPMDQNSDIELEIFYLEFNCNPKYLIRTKHSVRLTDTEPQQLTCLLLKSQMRYNNSKFNGYTL